MQFNQKMILDFSVNITLDTEILNMYFLSCCPSVIMMKTAKLLPRLTQSVLNPDESKLTLNKHRPLYVNLILRKELRRIYYVEQIIKN